MRQYLLFCALCAFLITAACDGSDPPGGGNGDTDGGMTDNGGNTVNLIEAIPGRWRVVRSAGMPPRLQYEDDVRVDVNDPDCQQRIAETYGTLGPDGDPTGGPSGNACIIASDSGIGFYAIILDGTSIRFDAREPDGVNGEIIRIHQEGEVREDGTRMEYWSYNHGFNPPDRALVEVERCGDVTGQPIDVLSCEIP